MRRLLAALALCGCSWRTGDWIAQGAVGAVIYGDAITTHRFLKYTNRIETNVILGKHPSDLAIVAYFLACTAIEMGIAAALPDGWREGWEIPWIVVEGWQVGWNQRDGVGVLPW